MIDLLEVPPEHVSAGMPTESNERRPAVRAELPRKPTKTASHTMAMTHMRADARDEGRLAASRSRGPFDVRALYEALNAERERRETSWAAIARETHVSAATISRTSDADDLEADGMLQLVRWIGLAPESFARDSQVRVPMAKALQQASGILRGDTRSLYTAIDEKRSDHCSRWSEVADELEVHLPKSRLTNLRKGGRSTAQTLLSASRWLGRESLEFLRIDSRSLEWEPLTGPVAMRLGVG